MKIPSPEKSDSNVLVKSDSEEILSEGDVPIIENIILEEELNKSQKSTKGASDTQSQLSSNRCQQLILSDDATHSEE